MFRCSAMISVPPERSPTFMYFFNEASCLFFPCIWNQLWAVSCIRTTKGNGIFPSNYLLIKFCVPCVAFGSVGEKRWAGNGVLLLMWSGWFSLYLQKCHYQVCELRFPTSPYPLRRTIILKYVTSSRTFFSKARCQTGRDLEASPIVEAWARLVHVSSCNGLRCPNTNSK